jgi:hypothetical protein
VSCISGYVNVGGTYPTGCSCKDDTAAKSCAAATSLGTLSSGDTTGLSETGVLPASGESNWYAVTFATDPGNRNYHPKITITGDTGVVFGMYTNCSGTLAVSCQASYGGDGTLEGALTTWEVQETDANTPIDAPIPITHINPNGTGQVWIEVYRASGGLTCNNYTLTVTD